MREYLALAKNNDAGEPEVRRSINEIKRTYGDAARAA
jgi:hypothetical protein